MKWYAKINRGVIVTAVVVFGVIVYLIGVEVSRGLEKGAIRQVCRDYVAAESAALLLPGDYRSSADAMPQAEIDRAVAETGRELTGWFTDAQAAQSALVRVENELRAQAGGTRRLTGCSREIRDMEFVFVDGEVQVSLTMLVTLNVTDWGETADGGEPAAQTRQIHDTVWDDELVLRKVDGEWKLTYSGLTLPYEWSAYDAIPADKFGY